MAFCLALNASASPPARPAPPPLWLAGVAVPLDPLFSYPLSLPAGAGGAGLRPAGLLAGGTGAGGLALTPFAATPFVFPGGGGGMARPAGAGGAGGGACRGVNSSR